MVQSKVRREERGEEFGEWLARHAGCLVWHASAAEDGKMVKYVYCPIHKEMYNCGRKVSFKVEGW